MCSVTSAVEAQASMSRTGALISLSFLAVSSAFGISHAKPVDLRRTDWLDVSVPGSVCRLPDLIRLRGGDAVVRSDRWPPWRRVHVTDSWTAKPVTYGSFDGAPAAALNVNCNNGGGTADGVLAYAQVIFKETLRGPRVIGSVTPRIQPRNEPASLLQVSFRGTRIIAHEYFYSPAEGICCPSGRATSIWRYARGHLARVSTTVTKKP